MKTIIEVLLCMIICIVCCACRKKPGSDDLPPPVTDSVPQDIGEVVAG